MYILRCRDGAYYVGSTTNADYRIQQHKDGLGGDYTARRLPVGLVFGEEFPTLPEAFSAEREVKGWSRAKKEALIRRDYAALPELSWSTQRRALNVLRQAQDENSGVAEHNEASSPTVGYARG